MPNLFEVKGARGSLTLSRRWLPDKQGRKRPPVGGGGSRAGLPGPSTAGRTAMAWSRRSQMRMRLEFGALPWEVLGPRPAMITLTYPRNWQAYGGTAAQLRKHREAFKERWRRTWGPPVGVWVVEFQSRGAPHLHMYLGLPEGMSDAEYWALQARTMRRRKMTYEVGAYEARRQMRAVDGEFGLWLRQAWWEVVGSGSKAHHARGVDVAVQFWSDRAASTADRARVAEYMWRESGKWAQKQPPPGFGSLRFWGRWGKAEGFAPVFDVEQVPERAAYELRRVMRRWRLDKERQQAATRGYRFRPGKPSRGRDGLTVFGVDGAKWLPLLAEWSTSLAVAKAAEEEGPYEPTRYPPRPFLRAFSELDSGAPEDPEARYERWRETHGDEDFDEWIARRQAAEEAAYNDWYERNEAAEWEASIDAMLAERYGPQ